MRGIPPREGVGVVVVVLHTCGLPDGPDGCIRLGRKSAAA